ncbi:MAG TPA: CPBP family intramembrane glutamic endopeptidase [Candidatus Limnocylindrales bacterium]|nr:CPBP family intramembrane glutamic endopeptidase [Candidatus Limnocylindrales bacterium]
MDAVIPVPVLSRRAQLLATGGPALLLLGAVAPDLRPTVAAAVVVGWVLIRAGRSPAAIAWAAVLPLAVVLAWPWVLGVDTPIGDPACRDPFSIIAVRRVIVGVVGLALVGALAVAHGSTLRELGLSRPGRREGVVAAGGCAVLAVIGLFVGPLIARPFFGALDFPVPAAALVPAVLFGIANGVLEEVLYRGAMQAWLRRVAPLWLAIGFQGLVFGIVHAGPEVQALLPVHIGLLTSAGVAAGIARWRFGSLAIPIGIHVGADIALYVGLACRAAA